MSCPVRKKVLDISVVMTSIHMIMMIEEDVLLNYNPSYFR